MHRIPIRHLALDSNDPKEVYPTLEPGSEDAFQAAVPSQWVRASSPRISATNLDGDAWLDWQAADRLFSGYCLL